MYQKTMKNPPKTRPEVGGAGHVSSLRRDGFSVAQRTSLQVASAVAREAVGLFLGSLSFLVTKGGFEERNTCKGWGEDL